MEDLPARESRKRKKKKKKQKEQAVERNVRITDTFKISCKHIGLIIGPMGNTLFFMQRRTDTRITIPKRTEEERREQQRDRKSKETIEIYGFPENIDKAKAELGFVIANGRPKMDSESGYNVEGVEEIAEEIRIPNTICGMLMGEKGQNIKRIQNETNCHIWLDWNDNATMESGISTVYLMGIFEEVELAKMEIDKIREIFGGVGGRGQQNSIFEIPEHAGRILIGPKGETIRQLQMETKCTIKVIKNEQSRYDVDCNRTSMVKVIGNEQDRRRCIFRIQQILGESDLDIDAKRCQGCKQVKNDGEKDKGDGMWYCSECWQTFEEEKKDQYLNNRYGSTNAFGVKQDAKNNSGGFGNSGRQQQIGGPKKTYGGGRNTTYNRF